MPVPDAIEREIVLPSTRAEVWAALTTPEGLSAWWCEGVELELRPGGAIMFDFGEYGKYPATVEAVEPQARFVITGRPFQNEEGADAVPELTIKTEFRLEDHPDGTLLRLRESGFAALSEAFAAKTLQGNEEGWDQVLGQLRTYLATGAPTHQG